MSSLDLHSAPHAQYSFMDPATGSQGWLVIDTLVDGLAFGGFRFHPTVTQEEVQNLARCMTWKLACHGLPTGGAKAGLAIDPSEPNTKDILKRFIEHIREPLLSHVMLGKDMGATDQLLDQVYEHLGVPQMHVTQKRHGCNTIPSRLRDLTGYCTHMTGRGVAIAAAQACGDTIGNATIAIQGFGLVGAGSAYRLSQLGAHIVAIADMDGAVSGDKLPLDALIEGGRLNRRVNRQLLRGGSQSPDPDEVLRADVDVLVLAAGSHVVDAARAHKIRAPLVVEGANFALTPQARVVLHERGITVIPDVLASSASAALVARQMARGNTLSEEVCWNAIRDSITEATRKSLHQAAEDQVQVRQAYLEGISDSLLATRHSSSLAS